MGFAFVNNTDLAQATSNQDTNREEMIDKCQEFMKRWEGSI